MTVKPVKQLKPLQLLERGSLVRITGCAFVAGVLPFKVCTRAIHYKTKAVCTRMNTRFTAINIHGFKSEPCQYIPCPKLSPHMESLFSLLHTCMIHDSRAPAQTEPHTLDNFESEVCNPVL